MGVFLKAEEEREAERGEGVGEDSCQLLCGFRTALADVGRATIANSLSRLRFTNSQDAGG